VDGVLANACDILNKCNANEIKFLVWPFLKENNKTFITNSETNSIGPLNFMARLPRTSVFIGTPE